MEPTMRSMLDIEARVTGRCGPEAGILARYLLFYEREDAGGDISPDEIERDTGLSPDHQNVATRQLTNAGLMGSRVVVGASGRERRVLGLDHPALMNLLD